MAACAWALTGPVPARGAEPGREADKNLSGAVVAARGAGLDDTGSFDLGGAPRGGAGLLDMSGLDGGAAPVGRGRGRATAVGVGKGGCEGPKKCARLLRVLCNFSCPPFGSEYTSLSTISAKSPGDIPGGTAHTAPGGGGCQPGGGCSGILGVWEPGGGKA